MLSVLCARAPESESLKPSGDEKVVFGLHEDTDYCLTWGAPQPGDRLYIDDVEVPADHHGRCAWRPEFYAGRVRVELVRTSGSCERFWLDVGPSVSKSGYDSFIAMVEDIRTADAALLGGESAASLLFGRYGREGLFTEDILFSRIQTYLPQFLDAVQRLMRSLHQALAMEMQVLPLSRVRRLTTSALRDRRLATIIGGCLATDSDYFDVHLRGRAPVRTFDTPANQALVTLMRRLQGAVGRLILGIQEERLGVDRTSHALRKPRRLALLQAFDEKLRRLLVSSPFDAVRRSGVTAAGLTQIAAHPGYSRAYSLGSLALNTFVQGDGERDLLHTAPSWGIYETWCYLRTVNGFASAVGASVERIAAGSSPVSADLGYRCKLADGIALEFLFQAVFPAGSPAGNRTGYSISRERRPDILVVRREADKVSCMVLDAKWRSGRNNVLEAMESAHIYHDSLRLGLLAPELAVLLLPGKAAVPSLEAKAFQQQHGVGAISEVNPAGSGVSVLLDLLTTFAGGQTQLQCSG